MSTIKTDTIVASDGSSPVTLTKQSAAKAWANTNQTSTQSNRDSFNVASITDGGLGVTTLAFTNSMNNANYSATGQEGSTNTIGYALQMPYNTAANTSSQYAFTGFNGGRTAAADASVVSSAVHGDLA
jgi:hypothetical protein